GMLGYMSPEQCRDVHVVTASDRYSLAAVAYEMLTGRVPYKADSAAAVLLSHVTRPMPATEELSGEALAHVEDVLRRGLAKDPDERYATASSFVRALRPAAWLGGLDGGSSTAAVLETRPAGRRI